MKGHLLFFAACVILSPLMVINPSAQEEPNFDDILESAGEDFKEMKRRADEEFSQMKSEVDAEFGDLLANAWKEFELARGIVRDETPKPEEVPVARPEDVPPPAPEPEPESAPEPAPEPEPVPPSPEPESPREPPAPAPAPEPEPRAEQPPPPPPDSGTRDVAVPRKSGEPLAFNFYDALVRVTFDPSWRRNTTPRVDQATIRAFWERYSRTSYPDFLEQAAAVKSELALNDWGYCVLLDYLSAGICGAESLERPLFIWFMLVHSGYDARIGFKDNQAYVLIPSENTIFQAPFYQFGDRRYYITALGASSGSARSLFTYEGATETASRSFDFSMPLSPAVGKKMERRDLSFTYLGRDYSLPVDINTNVVRFYDHYPQIDLDVYFDSALSDDTGAVLLSGLGRIIAGRNEAESVNIILRFVQTAFNYATDDDQFGVENYLFPEETLYYPSCDCEDRSFLFAWLVHELLDLHVIGLEYPGHLATAVRFSEPVPGDAVTYNGDRYAIYWRKKLFALQSYHKTLIADKTGCRTNELGYSRFVADNCCRPLLPLS